MFSKCDRFHKHHDPDGGFPLKMSGTCWCFRNFLGGQLEHIVRRTAAYGDAHLKMKGLSEGTRWKKYCSLKKK